MYEIIEKLRAGDHAALFYKSRAEQLAIVVPFIAIGLQRGERCLYIADDTPVAMIIDALEKGGVNVESAQKSGALTVSTKHHTYLKHGIFEPAKMTDGLCDEVQESLRQGYTAFRATGEMTWALSLSYALAQLAEYEMKLHARFPGQLIGMCQYDERGFNERIIADMIRIHPVVIARGKLMVNRFHQAGATVETLLPSLVTVDEVVHADNALAHAC